MLIGRVTNVALTDADSKVLVTAEIQSDKILYRNEELYITRDLFGDTALVFIPNPKLRGTREAHPPGATLDGRVSDDPTGLEEALAAPIDTVTETGQALKDASEELKLAANRINRILDTEDQHIRDLLRNAAESLKAIRKSWATKRRRPSCRTPCRNCPTPWTT